VRRVACVFAHPDDDTYGVGGSLALHAREAFELTVVLATSGEAGQIADASLATREELGRVRETEDAASWRALGLAPDLRFLRHPDGGLPRLREELVPEVREILHEVQPEVVFTFGPDGITGHEDHVTIGQAATLAFHTEREGGSRRLVRLLHVAITAGDLERLNELLRERGLEPMDPTRPLMPRGVPDEAIGVRVDVSGVYERKLEALRSHKTQAELEDLPFDLWPDLLATESFVMAWPPREPGSPVLGDPFEGLSAS
jgi:LmbE family N-acetylglucosaminyl deacetylase